MTAVAAGAGAGQFNIGVDVATTLANFNTAFGAVAFSYKTNTQSETDGASVFRVMLNDFEESGTVYTLATNRPALVKVSGSTMFEPVKADAIDPAKGETFIIDLANGGGYDMFTLRDGSEGQSLTVYVKGPQAFQAVLIGSFHGVLVLDIDGYAVLRFLGGKWRPVVNTGTFLT